MITYWDIETEPAPADVLAAFEPEFEAPGNLKDPDKIAAAIAAKRAEWIERAALSPVTGRIVAIGYLKYELTTIYAQKESMPEMGIIENFFERVTFCAQGAYGKMAGFNIHGFDLPFIVRRALALGIPVPVGLIPNGATRFYWPSMFLDLRAIWGMGELNPAGSLDVVARYLGLPGKNGKGAEFARLYRGTADERGQALEYLANDLKVTASIGARFGLK